MRAADGNHLDCSSGPVTTVAGLGRASRGLVVGPVTLYPLKERADPRTAGNYVPDADGRVTPDEIDAIVEPGKSVKLIVPRNQRKLYSLWYGKTRGKGIYSPSRGLRMRVDEGAIAVRIDGCSDGRDRRGGFILSRPACVTLDIYYDGVHHPTKAGFGTRCP